MRLCKMEFPPIFCLLPWWLARSRVLLCLLVSYSPLAQSCAKRHQFCLHQAVLECLAANESTYKFKPSVALKRHQSLNDLDVQDDDVALADASEQVPANDPAENAVAVAVN